MSNEKKILALTPREMIDEIAENYSPKDSPSYRQITIRKEDFVHELTKAYLLGRKDTR